jgi:hypothetical protein
MIGIIDYDAGNIKSVGKSTSVSGTGDCRLKRSPGASESR